MALREPFNSVSHMVGAGLAVAGLVALVLLADGAVEVVAAVAYGVGLLSMYALSAVFHGVHATPRTLAWLERLDRVAIYLLIAGTYTPVALVLLGGAWGWSLFGTAWGLAAAGMALVLTAPLRGKAVHVVLYVVLGWMALAFLPVLLPRLSADALWLLFGGGVLYTAGAALYVWDPPRLVGRLGGHEVWHVLVLLASLAHFAFVARHVLA